MDHKGGNQASVQQRQLENLRMDFDRRAEKQQSILSKEQIELKRKLKDFDREKKESRQMMQKTKAFLNDLERAEKESDGGRRRASVAVTTRQGIEKLLKPDQASTAMAQQRRASVGVVRKLDAGSSRPSSGAYPGTSAGTPQDPSTSQSKRLLTQNRMNPLKEDSTLKLKQPPILTRPDKLLQEKEANSGQKEVLDEWIKVLSQADNLPPESLADFVVDERRITEPTTSKRSQKHRMTALEKVLSTLPGLHKNKPGITAYEALHCSYLRLPPRLIEELEELCWLDGKDPGVHPHMTESQIEVYFRRKDEAKKLELEKE